MAVYLYNLVSIPIYGALIKNRKWLIFLISTQMFLILALRAETIGVDLDNYSTYFYYYQNYSFLDILKSFRFIKSSAIPWGHESGFVLLSWFVGKLGLEFHALMVVVAAISIAGIGSFVYRYAEDVTLSYMCVVALGVFNTLFGILRQSCGLAIFFAALPALKRRNAKIYFSCVIAATLFHVVFLTMIPLWFLAKIKMNRSWAAIVAGGSMAMTLVFPILLKFILDPFLVKLGRGYGEVPLVFQWNNMFIFILAIFLMVVFLDRSGKSSLKAKQPELSWGFAMALPIQATAFFLPTISRAAIGIFLPVGCVLLGNVLCNYRGKKIAGLIRIVLCLFLIVFYAHNIRGNTNLVPYVAIFS